jgi:hypothetical protein
VRHVAGRRSVKELVDYSKAIHDIVKKAVAVK